MPGGECKAQETIALPAWWKQCTRNAAAEGLAPLLILKQSRREPLAVLRWTDLLSLLRHDHRWENLAEGLPGVYKTEQKSVNIEERFIDVRCIN